MFYFIRLDSLTQLCIFRHFQNQDKSSQKLRLLHFVWFPATGCGTTCLNHATQIIKYLRVSHHMKPPCYHLVLLCIVCRVSQMSQVKKKTKKLNLIEGMIMRLFGSEFCNVLYMWESAIWFVWMIKSDLLGTK